MRLHQHDVTTDISRLHPSTGECSSPPLGGDPEVAAIFIRWNLADVSRLPLLFAAA